MGRRLLSRTLPLGDWQTTLARFCFAVDAGCRFAGGRLDGNCAPCCRSLARYAVIGQAKHRSPVHLLARFRTRPHEIFSLDVRCFNDGCRLCDFLLNEGSVLAPASCADHAANFRLAPPTAVDHAGIERRP
jgi:hypothetical protein